MGQRVVDGRNTTEIVIVEFVLRARLHGLFETEIIRERIEQWVEYRDGRHLQLRAFDFQPPPHGPIDDRVHDKARGLFDPRQDFIQLCIRAYKRRHMLERFCLLEPGRRRFEHRTEGLARRVGDEVNVKPGRGPTARGWCGGGLAHRVSPVSKAGHRPLSNISPVVPELYRKYHGHPNRGFDISAVSPDVERTRGIFRRMTKR